MTWAEWVESDYNTDGFRIVDTGDDYGITICKGSYGIYQSS